MEIKDYIENIAGAERRYAVADMRVEKRAADNTEAIVVEGYAALYNSPTEMYWYDEEILPGAFDGVLNDDVRCLFNHNPNYILARCVNGKGTLELELDSKGLKYRYTTPDRQYARDLAVLSLQAMCRSLHSLFPSKNKYGYRAKGKMTFVR